MKYKKLLIGLLICVMSVCGCGAASESEAETTGLFGELSGKMDELIENNKRAKQEPIITDEMRQEVDDACQNMFYYRQLDQTQKEIYQEVYESIVLRQESAVSTLDMDLLDEIYNAVTFDHPELFQTEGYGCTQITRGDVPVNLLFLAKYNYSQEEQLVKQQAVDSYTAQCLLGMDASMDSYQKVKYIYDYIIGQTNYDLSAKDSQNILSVMEGHASVCQGYAEATQYLLQKSGIEATTVVGYANGSNHAWNLVLVDDDYYYLDTTWGDVDYQLVEGAEHISETNVINYDYFLITTSQLEKTHQLADQMKNLPLCDATKDNYFVREGLLFTQFSTEEDKQKLKDIFAKAAEGNEPVVTVRCADDAVYDQMIAHLIDEKHVFDYLTQNGDISYAKDRESGTITVWMNAEAQTE